MHKTSLPFPHLNTCIASCVLTSPIPPFPLCQLPQPKQPYWCYRTHSVLHCLVETLFTIRSQSRLNQQTGQHSCQPLTAIILCYLHQQYGLSVCASITWFPSPSWSMLDASPFPQLINARCFPFPQLINARCFLLPSWSMLDASSSPVDQCWMCPPPQLINVRCFPLP